MRHWYRCPMRYRAGLQTRDRILEATKASLAERGLEGTTIKEICTRADVRAGSFYNLFESKEEAILAVLGEAITAVDPHPDAATPDTVDELIEAYIRFVAGEPALAKVYLGIAIGGALTDADLLNRVLRHHERRLERFRTALIAEAPELTLDEATLQAEAILATINGFALHAMLDPSFDFSDHVRRLRSSAKR